MLRRLVSLFAALLLCASQASANFVINPYVFGAGAPVVALYRATCATSTTDTNAYTFNGNTITGLSDGASVLIVVGVMAEDNATTYTIDDVTIEGTSGSEVVDEGGAVIVSSGIWQRGAITGAASVDVTVTFSEAVTGAAVCIWALENLDSTTAQGSDGTSQADSNSAITFVLGTPSGGGYALGICTSQSATLTTTWTVLTEVQDANSAEYGYSNADAVTTGGAMSPTCKWGDSGNDQSGAAVAFR